MTNTWTNADGLYLKFGTTEGTVATEGEYSLDGPFHVAEWEINYSDLGASAAIMGDTVTVPAGARIIKTEIETVTAFDSSADAFVLNIGLIDQDRTTELDYNGLVAAIPQAAVDGDGELASVDFSHTYKGVLVGTTLTNTGLLTADYDTAAPTVGKAKVRVFYRMIS